MPDNEKLKKLYSLDNATLAFRLRRWAAARHRREPFHGRTGTTLLKVAADRIGSLAEPDGDEKTRITELVHRLRQYGDLIVQTGQTTTVRNASVIMYDAAATLVSHCLNGEEPADPPPQT